MSNLEWLDKAKKAEGKFIEGEDFEYRKTKALEIIAEELCKFNLTADVLSSVIEAVANQGNSLNINGRVSINK